MSDPQEPTGWQPIATAPIGVDVLIYDPDAADWARVMICHRFDDDGEWYGQDADMLPHPLDDISPTHWMELPAAPNKEQR